MNINKKILNAVFAFLITGSVTAFVPGYAAAGESIQGPQNQSGSIEEAGNAAGDAGDTNAPVTDQIGSNETTGNTGANETTNETKDVKDIDGNLGQNKASSLIGNTKISDTQTSGANSAVEGNSTDSALGGTSVDPENSGDKQTAPADQNPSDNGSTLVAPPTGNPIVSGVPTPNTPEPALNTPEPGSNAPDGTTTEDRDMNT